MVCAGFLRFLQFLNTKRYFSYQEYGISHFESGSPPYSGFKGLQTYAVWSSLVIPVKFGPVSSAGIFVKTWCLARACDLQMLDI